MIMWDGYGFLVTKEEAFEFIKGSMSFGEIEVHQSWEVNQRRWWVDLSGREIARKWEMIGDESF